ncbi:MAG: ferrochelatase [Verrucomicrobia bacterium]|nr:ferrochelatase [Verrucomicrobiota bacterium]
MSKGVLLVNVGSPASTSIRDVRRYLREFLMDPYVLDAPYPVRFMIVNLIIAPFRSKKSARAYRRIWREDGSPLIALSRALAESVQERVSIPVRFAMRYGEPSIESVIGGLRELGVRELLLIPLYPQYAMSTRQTTIEKVKSVLGRMNDEMRLTVKRPFFDDAAYMNSLISSARPALTEGFDHLLFSFHGLPERHVRKTDPTGNHCLSSDDCCDNPGAALETCYRAQSLAMVKTFARVTGIEGSRISYAFQSRLGKGEWLKPYLNDELLRLSGRGVKDLAVICPSFVSDCLETLEEVGDGAREKFLSSGGRRFTLIPCLNDHPHWINTVAGWIKDWN